MIMIKDNHIDFCGGVEKALNSTKEYISSNKLNIKVVIEARNISEIQTILDNGNADRILIDNFTPEELKKAIELINGRIETEASGGINLYKLRKYAESGVDYISIGAIIHSAKILDLSLLANQI